MCANAATAVSLSFTLTQSETQDMGLASTTSTSSLLSATFCTARRGFPPPRHAHHNHFRFLSTLKKCNLNRQVPVGKNRGERVRCSAVEVEDEACELVNGVELSIGEGDDNIQAYLFKAVKNNNGSGVLLLSDIFGFQDSATRDFAYQVACHGYNVLVPDLFRGDPWAKNRPKTMFEQWLANQDPRRVANDIATSTKWMVDEFTAAGISKKLGIIGFCFGGGRVIDILAADQGACFSTAVSFYGTRMDEAAASKIKVPVLFISGDDDPLCPVSVLSEFEKIIGKGSRVVIFEGRGHAFAHRPGSLEEDEDAEQAFTLMRNWLHDALVINS
ncbi:Alpha/beta-Hydrolases superfamily protein isoform 2 [Hibiscus syriacus]|uniref:Carboxymethylenebutenolidase homolog n=1 Tax=Hibiscus syriacus TaxID=106335 RepID=A0A6A3ADN1_HIBSY|nr:carboxymethylenebutenolidase homolog [Hibiscus syriacus]KAE8702711.1 Alpha/beta-Hydrolases superfamily protein isoform 2 [Hibiscus syriacus]